MDGVTLVRGWTPGLLGWIVAEHGVSYERDWSLGRRFEAKVAEGLGELAGRPEPWRDLVLSARRGDTILGAICVDATGPAAVSDGARIRYFILAESARGLGLGRRLVSGAMAFIRAEGFDRAWLTTFSGLDAARHLYETEGFRLTREEIDTTWGKPLTEQRFDWTAG